jgi:hypothetical protein
MKTFYLILATTAFAGGLSVFWVGFYETVCTLFGCMRYTSEVTVFEHDYEEFNIYTVETKKPMNDNLRLLMRLFLLKKHPEIVPFSIISITFVNKRSVLMQTVCWWLYRACTRTADDAVHEWKERNGMAA